MLDQLGGFVNQSRVWTSDSGAVVFVLAVPLGANPSEREITQEAGSAPGASQPAWPENRKTKKDDYGAIDQLWVTPDGWRC